MFGNGKEPSGLIHFADKVSTVSQTLEGTSDQPSTAVPVHINSNMRGLTQTAEAETSVQQTLCTWLSLIVVTLAHCFKNVVFENELLPSIRTEQIWEDPAHSFASAINKARKHAPNNLHVFNATNSSLIVSTLPPPKHHLETRLDDVQAIIASLIEAPAPSMHHKRGRSKTERRPTQGRHDNSASKRDRSSSKAKATCST